MCIRLQKWIKGGIKYQALKRMGLKLGIGEENHVDCQEKGTNGKKLKCKTLHVNKIDRYHVYMQMQFAIAIFRRIKTKNKNRSLS